MNRLTNTQNIKKVQGYPISFQIDNNDFPSLGGCPGSDQTSQINEENSNSYSERLKATSKDRKNDNSLQFSAAQVSPKNHTHIKNGPATPRFIPKRNENYKDNIGATSPKSLTKKENKVQDYQAKRIPLPKDNFKLLNRPLNRNFNNSNVDNFYKEKTTNLSSHVKPNVTIYDKNVSDRTSSKRQDMVPTSSHVVKSSCIAQPKGNNQREQAKASEFFNPVTSSKKKRKSKVKRLAALQTGKLKVFSAEVHTKFFGEQNPVYIVPEKTTYVNIDDTEEYPELGVTGVFKSNKSSPVKKKEIISKHESADEELSKNSENKEKLHQLGNEDLYYFFKEESKKNEKKEKTEADLKKSSHSTQPIQLTLFDMLKSSKPKVKEYVSGIDVDNSTSHKNIVSKPINKASLQSVNQLDASRPVLKRGKERENPKPKKPSSLKKIILIDRMARKQNKLLQSKSHNNDHNIENNNDTQHPERNGNEVGSSNQTEVDQNVLENNLLLKNSSETSQASENVSDNDLLHKDFINKDANTCINKYKCIDHPLSLSKTKIICDNVGLSDSSNVEDLKYFQELVKNYGDSENMEKNFEHSGLEQESNEVTIAKQHTRHSYDRLNFNECTVPKKPNDINQLSEDLQLNQRNNYFVADFSNPESNVISEKNTYLQEEHSLNAEESVPVIHRNSEMVLNVDQESVIPKHVLDCNENIQCNEENASSDNQLCWNLGNLLKFEKNEPDENRLKAVKILLHTNKFKEYCDHFISKDIDLSLNALIGDLVRFQDRLHQKNPLKARVKRRLIYGLKEIKKHLKLKKLKCIIMAADIEDVKSEGGLNDLVKELKTLADISEIPCVFSQRRNQLGKLCHKPVPVSCVGVFNYEGSEKNFKDLLELQSQSKHDYDELVQTLLTKLSDAQINTLIKTHSDSPERLMELRVEILKDHVILKGNAKEGFENSVQSCDKCVISESYSFVKM